MTREEIDSPNSLGGRYTGRHGRFDRAHITHQFDRDAATALCIFVTQQFHVGGFSAVSAASIAVISPMVSINPRAFVVTKCLFLQDAGDDLGHRFDIAIAKAGKWLCRAAA